ncbi:MAG: sn-glycerol-3-phosphate ABC transporter ATP-binding protein UgpC [Gammaproteobacteria bacterium]
MAAIKLHNIKKAFGKVEILHGIDIEIADGEFCVFVGPSGCGKSTLLRLIAGLDSISSGDLTIDGQRVNHLSPPERGIAMVFQSYALYPHMTVYKNMAFGLKMNRRNKAEIDQKVRKTAAILQLEDLLDRRPAQLSGGQRQRVAIGRAIVREPKVFLFDEPLSNLDAALRVQTRIEIANLHQDLKSTVIYVTHDQVEAMTLADKIVVLNEGRVAQIGSPLELYHYPQNLFVAGFIGSPKMNFIQGRISSLDGSYLTVSLADELVVPRLHIAPGAVRAGDTVTLGIRPEHLREGGEGTIQLQGKVKLVERLGDNSYVYLQLPAGTSLIATTPGSSRVRPGDTLTVSTDSAAVHVFDAQGQAFERLGDDPRYRL